MHYQVWHYDRADYWGMQGHLSSVNWMQALQTDPETACSNITNIICEAMDLYIPSKQVSRKTGDKPWFDDHCRRAAKKKCWLFKKMKKHDMEENKKKFEPAQSTKKWNNRQKHIMKRNSKRNRWKPKQ